jgi:hypothetical protein
LDVYRPFTRAESDVLRGFVAGVRRLGEMRFFKQVPKTAMLNIGGTAPHSDMEEPDDEDLSAAISQFRQIYNPHEPHSFSKAMKLLKKSAHERNGPLRSAAIADLDGHVDAAREALEAGIGIGIVFDEGSKQRDMDPSKILDAYFHGQYLHSGNEKSELARRLDDLPPFPRLTLYHVMLALRNVYWIAANAVDRVLAVPALLDTDAQPTRAPAP